MTETRIPYTAASEVWDEYETKLANLRAELAPIQQERDAYAEAGMEVAMVASNALNLEAMLTAKLAGGGGGMMFEQEQRILTTAIETWQPVAIVSLFSAGYDSTIATHILHQLDTDGLPIDVWSIDTQLAADGWREYVTSVANMFNWHFKIYDNKKGFKQYLKYVEGMGCPRTRKGHTYAFFRLKERGIDAILKMYKTNRGDRVLFVSGMRRAESPNRKNHPEFERIGRSCKVFASPIVHWSNDQCDRYRIENNLPDNPFYGTVKGSGDCQCNWGRFITLRMLQKHSPELAAGNVAEIDRLSRELHGYGWDGKPAAQTEMFEEFEDDSELTGPFLCEGCSRAKVRVPSKTIEYRLLQGELF